MRCRRPGGAEGLAGGTDDAMRRLPASRLPTEHAETLTKKRSAEQPLWSLILFYWFLQPKIIDPFSEIKPEVGRLVIFSNLPPLDCFLIDFKNQENK